MSRLQAECQPASHLHAEQQECAPRTTSCPSHLIEDGAQAHADAGRLLGAPVHAVWPRGVDLGARGGGRQSAGEDQGPERCRGQPFVAFAVRAGCHNCQRLGWIAQCPLPAHLAPKLVPCDDAAGGVQNLPRRLRQEGGKTRKVDRQQTSGLKVACNECAEAGDHNPARHHLDVERPPQAQHVGGQLAAWLSLLHGGQGRQMGRLLVKMGYQLLSTCSELTPHLNQHISQVGPAQSLPHAVVVGGCITGNQGASSLPQVCEFVTQAGGERCVISLTAATTGLQPACPTPLSPPFHIQVAACTDSAWCDSSGSRLMRPMTCCPPGCCVRLTGSHASSSLGHGRWGAAGAQTELVGKRASEYLSSCRWGKTYCCHHSCSLHCSPRTSRQAPRAGARSQAAWHPGPAPPPPAAPQWSAR